MSARWLRRARRLRRVAVYSVAGMVILAGLAVAVASRLMPLVHSHPQQLAAWLSERSGQQVAFRFGAAEWTRRGPRFVLDGLRVGSGAGALDIGRAELLVDVYAGLLPGRALTELRLRGADVQLQRAADGRWRVAGLGGGEAVGARERLRQLQGLGEIQLENARVQVADAASGRSLAFDRVDVRLRSVGDRVHVGASAWRGDGAPLTFAAELDAERGNARGYVGGRGVDLARWSAGLEWSGIALHGGHADLSLWFDLRAGRVVEMRAEVDAQALSLRGTEPVHDATVGGAGGLAVEARTGIDALALSARWRALADGGWELSMPRLELDDGGERAAAQGLLLRRDAGLRLQATALELGAPLSMAMLSERVPARLRSWLYLAAPHGRIEDLRVHCGEDGDGCAGQARLSALRWRPAGAAPGVRGLGGELHFSKDAALLDLDAPMLRLDAPRVFRAPIAARLDGRVHALREAGAWTIGSDALSVRGSDFAATATGSARFESGGGRPALDLFVDVAPASVLAARQFWIPAKMPPKVIAWLDRALVSGMVTDGRMVLRGDLDQWPFDASEGVFDAEVGLDRLVLDYRPGEWPRGEELHGRARFRDGGMEAQAAGSVGGVAVENVEAVLPKFREPLLELAIDGRGDGSDLLALLRASPLQQRFASHLLGVGIGGSAQVHVDIVVPLKKELGKPSVQGTADLLDADLSDAKWGLAFDGATGRVRFGDRGFAAEELRVRFAAQPGTLSIAIGDYASTDALAAEASLRGRFDADSLLALVPALDWLLPYLDGTSDWSLLLTVPEAEAPGQRVLRARSDLVGTTLSLPAPLRKHADAKLPLDVAARLPLAAGGVDVRLGELLHLQGSFPAGGSFTGVASFGAAEAVPAPDAGLRVVGTVPVLDAVGWGGVVASRPATAAATGESARVVADVDVRAGELDVFGRAFPETRLRVQPVGGDTHLVFNGEALEGTVVLPGRDAEARGITARFERLFWPSAGSAATPGGSALLGALAPSSVPPLHLWAARLRFGAAQLGEARLETWPTTEGLHVQSFETHSADMELRASGDWTRGRGGRDRSTFEIGFTAEDLGRMLDALGFAGMVEGGQTLARLDATWPGHPAAFELDRVDGRLELSVGQGSVPHVEPGAGRILGLLSLSEIPRRLSLDFSDFFNAGFSFNTIRGNFVLDGGRASTDDLVIDGAAAEIRVRGTTGLRQRTYDQTMEVLPRTSGVLPVVGALAAGPAGAALGAVAQAVLQRPMKQMTRVLYRVRGTWDAPQIEILERGPAPRAPLGPPG